jgi:ADP-ribose pyrophosphatase YjhB (NUDIX family)
VHPIGGKVDPNENPFSAAQREVLEETGLSVTNMRLEAVLLDIAPVPTEPHNWLIYHFSAQYKSGEVHQTDEGQLVWLTPRELSQERLHPSLQGIIDDILDSRTGTMFVTHKYDPSGARISDRHRDVCVMERPRLLRMPRRSGNGWWSRWPISGVGGQG